MKIFWSFFLLSFPCFSADVLDDFHGKASFLGKVVAPTCSVSMESKYQVIEFGIVPIRELRNGIDKQFSIRFKNCNSAHLSRKAYVSFNSVHGEDDKKFKFIDEAKGIDFEVINANGEKLRVGKQDLISNLYSGNAEIKYTIRMVNNGSYINAGGFYSVLRFNINYS
ncbi:fimbrial protein [Photobacterium damselae]|uniref:fimbrial protein n=1 Tax=Photobacterium damselae TaxID=38293 RepID=UPI003906FE0E